MGDEDNVQLQQNAQKQEFQTQQKQIVNTVENSYVPSQMLQEEKKSLLTDKKKYEQQLEKLEDAVPAEEITKTHKAAATDPDPEESKYQSDFQKTDIAFEKLKPEAPNYPKYQVRAGENELRGIT